MSRVTRNTVIGWGLYLILIIFVVVNVPTPLSLNIRLTGIFFSQIILFYMNYLWLTPKILEEKKTRHYFFITISFLILFSVFGAYTDYYIKESFNINTFDPEHPHSKSWGAFFKMLFPNSVSIVISSLVVKSNLLNQAKQEKLELKNKVLEAETMALKAQINPHFLFNAMNNIYALSHIDSTRTGDAILQLSHLLSYVTYEGEKDLVKLEDEVQYIRHFIDLQFLKDDNNSNISVQLQEDFSPLKIAPLLLIPFVENAFKHSNVFDKENGWVKINLEVRDSLLYFQVANSVGNQEQMKDKTGGIGLENVKKRLDLLYKGKYILNIEERQDTYNAELQIELTQ